MVDLQYNKSHDKNNNIYAVKKVSLLSKGWLNLAIILIYKLI